MGYADHLRISSGVSDLLKEVEALKSALADRDRELSELRGRVAETVAVFEATEEPLPVSLFEALGALRKP